MVWRAPWLELTFGMRVNTPDRSLGRLDGVVVDLRARRVTHLVVRQPIVPGLDLLTRATLALPIEWIVQQQPHQLTCLRRIRYNEGERRPFLGEDERSWTASFADQAVDLRDLVVGRAWSEKLGIARDWAAERGFAVIDWETGVYAMAQRLGVVDRLLVHPVGRHITHVVVRAHRFSRRLEVLPVEWIRKIGHKRLYVDTRLRRMDTLPAYPPDDDPTLSERIAEALLAQSPMGLGGITVRVVGKTVELAGIAPTETMRRVAEQIARRESGGRPVQNHVITDEAIVRQITQALNAQLGRAAAHVRVTSVLGTVRLEGVVPTPDVRERVEQIAAHAGVGATVIYNLTSVEVPAKQRRRTVLFGVPA